MNKTRLIQQIVAALKVELEGYTRSALSAHAEATDPQNKAENKYDTRGLEASYLAHGQSRQAAEVADAIRQYQAWVVPAFEGQAAIDLGAVVELDQGGEKNLYLMGPCAGGTELELGKRTVMVITPQSPLGQVLMGQRAGARVTLEGRGAKQVCRVLAVQ